MKHYVVFEGRVPGIYPSWSSCHAQVDKFKGASFRSYGTLKEAEEAYNSYEPLGERPRPKEGICSDACYSTVTRVMQFRVVDIATLEVVHTSIEYEDCEDAANIGEFLGLVRAIKYTLDHKLETPVYSDSVTAISWATNRKVKSLCTVEYANRGFKPLIEAALAYLEDVPVLPAIQKWHTRRWGEIPADFGRK